MPSRFLPLFFSALILFSHSPDLTADPSASLISYIAENLNKNFQSFQGIKAYLELELSQPGISPHHSFAQLAFRLNPDRLYFKTFSPLTPHYFTLISKGGNFWLQIPKTKTVYTGPLEAIGQENFEMKITPQDFKKIMVPNLTDKTPEDMSIEDQRTRWDLTLYGHVGTNKFKERILWIQKEGMKMVKDTRYSVDGRPYLEISWENFEKTGGTDSFPRLITLFKPSTGYLLRMKLKKVTLTNNIPEELFEVTDLASYKTVKVSH